MLVSIVTGLVAAYLGFMVAGMFSAVKLRDLRRAYLHLAEAVDEFTIHYSLAREDRVGARVPTSQHVSQLERALRESDQDFRAV